MSGWIELGFEVDALDVAALERALAELGALAVSLHASDGSARYGEPGVRAELWPRTCVNGLFDHDIDVDATLLRLAQWLPAKMKVIDETAWQRVWMKRYKPLQISRELWIRPSWCKPIVQARHEIVLDPGMAFGTGTHLTTQLCLRWLCARESLSGMRVIDYGCGSGILAIAAAKLEAASVCAVDVDVEALRTTADNAARNSVNTIVQPIEAPSLPGAPADVLIANILAGPLHDLAVTFANYVVPGGNLALSGIMPDQVEDLLATYRPWFSMGTPIVDERDGIAWVLLEGERRRGPQTPPPRADTEGQRDGFE